MEGVKSKVEDCFPVRFQTILREEGKLTVIEQKNFTTQRVYYIYDVPDNSIRGNHAHKTLYQILVAVNGSLKVKLNDGERECEYLLDKPNKGVLIVPGIWRELLEFSDNAICLVLASEVYNEDDYIRNYDDFLLFKSE